MLKVALLDDSKTARFALRKALESDSTILVVGEAANGQQLQHIVRRFDPDILLIDVYLETENGLDVASDMMRNSPRPIVMVTGIQPSNPQLIYKAMEIGVLDVFPKLPAATRSGYEEQKRTFLRAIKKLAAVPVLHSRAGHRADRPRKQISGLSPAYGQKTPTTLSATFTPNIILIGASTGGPPVVRKIIESLPKPCPVPVVVVQHISHGFALGFAKWLVHDLSIGSCIVTGETMLKPNMVYVAPDDQHLSFVSRQRVTTNAPKKTDNICPSINILFNSASFNTGTNAIAILLTGMGKDGALGLANLKKNGAYTIVQEPSDCAVASMPKTALDLDCTHKVLLPNDMAAKINELIKE